MRGDGGGGVAWSQPMSTAVHITRHGAQINFKDLPQYLTYGYDLQYVFYPRGGRAKQFYAQNSSFALDNKTTCICTCFGSLPTPVLY
jgi:hypothetical protein